ncbi:flagellar basal-body rod protein FlgB [Dorea sp. 5-2]|jgi:flagellar basal-body rod protein FlgB|nr:flagellar basal-body rod protein FlgB [Dorea sp. 5-2]MCI9022858.1 flagellar basal body rod protein FlgB [Dorea sp.]MDE6831099.1 flagellar basal body rod protein FlgB [Lachnospiraceae bacterium]
MIFGNTIAMSQKSLDFLWKQQEVLALNIANVETPGYKKKMVSFEDEYRKRLQAASQTKNTSKIRQAIDEADCLVYSRDDSGRVDENNVNADVENTKIARSTLHYQYLLQSVSNDIKRFQSVVKVQ